MDTSIALDYLMLSCTFEGHDVTKLHLPKSDEEGSFLQYYLPA